MPPKKGGKAKKDKKAEAGEGSAELDTPQLLKRAALRIQSLEQQLMWREKKEVFDVASDMTRQYKGMQEELLSRINLLENQINELKDQLEGSRLQLEETRREKAQELARKDAEIAEQKQKMEDMAMEFGEMLKETLDKMSERIEIANNSWEADTGAGVARRLEEFKMGVSTDR